MTNKDDQLGSILTCAGVNFDPLAADAHQQIETSWRDRYGQAFVIGARHRHGTKAVHEFLNQSERRWLLVPFLSRVEGTAVTANRPLLSAFRCDGPLQELSEYNGAEFFIAPANLSDLCTNSRGLSPRRTVLRAGRVGVGDTGSQFVDPATTEVVSQARRPDGVGCSPCAFGAIEWRRSPTTPETQSSPHPFARRSPKS